MEKWFIKNKDTDFKKLSKEFAINPILMKVLINRGIYEEKDIKKFLYEDINDLQSNSSLLGIEEGAEIVKNKIKSGKKIRIVGDYDVDGIMSVFILYKSLLELGAIVDYIIPNRVEEGYGINKTIVLDAKSEGIDTIITCDNGISAMEAAKTAKDLGLTLIITDHHDLIFTEDGENRAYIYPQADIIINPKNPKCTYSFKYLCGAGVVYKLIERLFKLYDKPMEKTHELLEFVAIATVCDVVDLLDENRIFVKHGINLINQTSNIGLRALIEESSIKGDINTFHLGFVIGPTFNAAGRIDTAYISLDLLLENDIEKAREIAKKLRKINEERKAMTEEGLKSAIDQVNILDIRHDKIIVIYEPSIHESIAGIIAGRIKDIYNKPTIVLTDGKDGIKGSGRSIEEYDMFEELIKSKSLLNKFGGHPMAAGVSLEKDNIEKLRISLNEKTVLNENDLVKKVYIDMALPIEYISYKHILDLKLLEPHGKANPKPIFGDRNLKVSRILKLGKNKNVLKLILKNEDKCTIEGLIFNDIENFENSIVEEYGKKELENLYKGIDNKVKIDILYYPSINEYMGKTSLQVIIQNFRIQNCS